MQVIVPETIYNFLREEPDDSVRKKLHSAILAVKLQEEYTEFKLTIASVTQSIISAQLSIFGQHISDIQVSVFKQVLLDKIIAIVSEKYPEYPYPGKP